MPDDIDSRIKKSPQFGQTDTGNGSHKAIIVDVRDPHMEANARVLVYAEQGDYRKLDIYALDWASPKQGCVGSYNPPKIGDRVWVDFEAGEKYSMVYYGSWNAAPMGDGTLPWNKSKGSDVPIEVQHSRDLYPEASMLKRSGNGNAIWMKDLFMNGAYLASSINLMDTAGKFIRISSIHPDLEQEYAPKDEFDEGEGQLHKGDIGEFKPVRKGYEHPNEIDPVPGSIEIGVHRLNRSMISGKEDFTQDRTVQKLDEETLAFEAISTEGKSFINRLNGISQQFMESSMVLFAPQSVRVPNFLSCPQRWDDEEEESDGGGGVLA